MTKSKSQHNFLMQGSILALAGILSRIIGLVFKIPMVGIIGDAGMGVYSTAYEIYNILLLISSYSLPMAVSKLVSARLSVKAYGNVRQIFRLALGFGLVLGGLAALAMALGADFFATRLMRMPECAEAIKALAPAVLIMGVLGVCRGFFQGHGSMVPTALSQILEQLLHVGVSLLAGYLLFRKGCNLDGNGEAHWSLILGAKGATYGVSVGALAALLFVGFVYYLYRPAFMKKVEKDLTPREGRKAACTAILLTAMPILISATIYNISGLLDQTLFANYIGDDYKSIWGAYNSKYLLLINVPIAVSSALSSSTMPVISADMTKGNVAGVRQKIAAAVRFCLLIALPAAVGLCALGKPCLDLLFPRGDNVLAGRMLAVGAAAVLTVSFSTLTVGILQGCGFFWVPIKNSLLALAVHLPLLALSLWVFKLGIMGVVVNHLLLYALTTFFNLRSLRLLVGYRQEWRKPFFLTAACAAMMGGMAYLLYLVLHHYLFGNAVSVVLAVFLAVVFYVVSIFFLGVVEEEDIRQMPKGGSILRLAKKLRLIK